MSKKNILAVATLLLLTGCSLHEYFAPVGTISCSFCFPSAPQLFGITGTFSPGSLFLLTCYVVLTFMTGGDSVIRFPPVHLQRFIYTLPSYFCLGIPLLPLNKYLNQHCTTVAPNDQM